MQKIQWQVEAAALPKAVRHCRRCHKKTNYLPSGMFRINAQQRYLDIWLIYKCDECGATWNLTVMSRINPRELTSKELERFHANDSELAVKYASDTALLKRNGAEVVMPEYEISGEAVDFTVPTRLMIQNKYPKKLKVMKLLKEKLGLSNAALEQMIECGIIREVNGVDLRKCRVYKEIVLLVGEE